MMMVKRVTGNRCIPKTGRLAFIFLLLFLVATLAAAFHHHEDGDAHHDCPVCAAGHHFSPASINNLCHQIYQIVSSNEIVAASLFYDSVQVVLLSSRAPPA